MVCVHFPLGSQWTRRNDNKIHFPNENSGSDKLSDFARFIRRAKVRPNFAYEVADKPYDDAGVTDQGKLGRKS